MQRYIPAEICSIRSLSKRWYIFYYHLIPGTTDYEFIKEYKGINRYKTTKKRLEAARSLRDARNELLSEGWSPYKDHQVEEFVEVADHTISFAFEKVMQLKKGFLRYTGFKSAKSRINAFLEYCTNKKMLDHSIVSIDETFLRKYLDSLKQKRQLSNRARNNHLIEIKSDFQLLKQYGYVKNNPAEHIKKLPESSEIHRPFTEQQLSELQKYMAIQEPYLLQFCHFVVYAFLRTTEIVNIRIKDIDLESDLLHIQSKTGFITKPIVTTLKNKLEHIGIKQYSEECYLFSSKGCPDREGTTREFFSHKFTRIKRDLGYSKFYTLYGLRHTFIQMLLNDGASDREVMYLTGHKSQVAFDAYKRNLTLKQPAGSDLDRFFKNRNYF
jgi:integrase